MKKLFLSAVVFMSFQVHAEAEIIKHQFKSEVTTDLYVRTGAGERACGGTVSISAFYYDFDEHIDSVILGRGGPIEKTWVVDSDKDNNPEVFVWVRSCGSGGYGTIYAYELMTYDEQNVRQNRSSIKWVGLDIPPVPSSLIENYRGHDSFKVAQDGLIRSFPQYRSNDSNAKPTRKTATLKYLFKDKKWVVLDDNNAHRSH